VSKEPKQTPGKAIIGAICECMASLGKVCKANRNDFGKYSFASIDDFLSASSGAMSAHGLMVMQQQLEFSVVDKIEKGHPQQHLLIKFGFIVMHESGETLPEIIRSVAVRWTDSQSFGSAQSYALKQFLRSLLQIATGDADDPDLDKGSRGRVNPGTLDITADQVSELRTLSLPFFDSHELFDAWILETCKKEVGVLKQSAHAKIRKFLMDHRTPDSWPEPKQAARLKVLENAGVKPESESESESEKPDQGSGPAECGEQVDAEQVDNRGQEPPECKADEKDEHPQADPEQGLLP